MPERTAYDERNSFLLFLLGLISLSERLSGCLAEYREAPPTPPKQPLKRERLLR